MNDFGVFQAIEQLVKQDEFLGKAINLVMTEGRAGVRAPYMFVGFKDVCVDIPCFVQSALMTCELMIVSDYHGDQEVHELMSRTNVKLDGAVLPVTIRAMAAQGKATFKLIGQNINKDKGLRQATLVYQVKINMERT